MLCFFGSWSTSEAIGNACHYFISGVGGYVAPTYRCVIYGTVHSHILDTHTTLCFDLFRDTAATAADTVATALHAVRQPP